MKRIITISAVLVLILTGCTNEPVANFAYSPANPVAGEDVYFDNLSLDAESFEWNFDDGVSSSVINPVHAFSEGGTYSVELKAFGRKGGMDVYYLTVNVISIDPIADFWVSTSLPTDDGSVSVETDIVFVGEQVEFNNISEDASGYLWSFGDGYTTDLASPVYSYDDPGIYTITLTALGTGSNVDTYTKTIEVVEGLNSALRITVKEWYDEYPVEGASVLLFETLDDWTNEVNSSAEVFTSSLGKCVFEGMNNQIYYVDVLEDNHNNYDLAEEDVGFIMTQQLEPGYIHDFIAWVDYVEKKVAVTRAGKKALAKKEVSTKKSSEYRSPKTNKFSKAR